MAGSGLAGEVAELRAKVARAERTEPWMFRSSVVVDVHSSLRRATPPRSVHATTIRPARKLPNAGLDGRTRRPDGAISFPPALDDPDRSSPSRVRFRRFAPWTAPGRSEGTTVYEGKGGMQISQ